MVGTRCKESLAFAGALVGVALSLCCGSATAPSPAGVANAVVVATDTTDVSVVDPRLGAVTAHLGPLPPFKDGGALSPDHATFYLHTELDFSTREIVAIDTRSLRIEWRVHTATLEQQAAGESLPVSIGGTMAVSPDGGRLLIQAAVGPDAGIAVMDLGTRTVVDFIPLATVIDMATLGASATMPNGAILVAGARQVGPNLYTGFLFVLDGATLALKDSIALASSTDDRSAGLEQVLAAPDGQHVYVAGAQQVRYDLQEHRVTDSVPTPSHGRLTIAPDGSTLYRTDSGDGRDVPGTGHLYVYDADLTPREPIDMTAVAATSEPLPVITQDAIPSADGTLLYVASGSPRATTYGGERARLLVLDTRTQTLVKAISLRGWSPDVLFIR